MRAINYILIGIILCIVSGWSMLHGNYKEADYAKEWALQNNALTEIVLPDNTRVDIMTSEYAIEVDYASKWAESIGQALYYASQTNRKPGIVLIVKPNDSRFMKRINEVNEYWGLHIRIWEIKHK